MVRLWRSKVAAAERSEECCFLARLPREAPKSVLMVRSRALRLCAVQGSSSSSWLCVLTLFDLGGSGGGCEESWEEKRGGEGVERGGETVQARRAKPRGRRVLRKWVSAGVRCRLGWLVCEGAGVGGWPGRGGGWGEACIQVECDYVGEGVRQNQQKCGGEEARDGRVERV